MNSSIVAALLFVVATSLSVVHSHNGPSIVYFPEPKRCALIQEAMEANPVCLNAKHEVCSFWCTDSGKLQLKCGVKAASVEVECSGIYCHRHDLDLLQADVPEREPQAEASSAAPSP